jgi:SAM-dependent methyltransferase
VGSLWDSLEQVGVKRAADQGVVFMRIVASLVDSVSAWVAWSQRNRVVSVHSPARVNLGSSLRVAQGWVNLDGSPIAFIASLPRPIVAMSYRVSGVGKSVARDQYVDVLTTNRFVHHRLEHRLPFGDNTVDNIFAGEVIEHLSVDVAYRVLRESRRVLRPGGVIRICVPDLRCAIDQYLADQKQEALGFFLYDNGRGGLSAHRSMWDYGLLDDALRAAGFSSVRRCTSRTGRTPNLDVLDAWPAETLLFVEAE